MATKFLSPQELRIWHAFLFMGEDVLGRVGRDIAQETGLSGSEFGVLSRLASLGKGEMRQQALATVMGWDKSRLSHQLTRMQQRLLIERRPTDGKAVLVVLTKLGRETGCCPADPCGLGSAKSVVAPHPGTDRYDRTGEQSFG